MRRRFCRPSWSFSWRGVPRQSLFRAQVARIAARGVPRPRERGPWLLPRQADDDLGLALRRQDLALLELAAVTVQLPLDLGQNIFDFGTDAVNALFAFGDLAHEAALRQAG